MAFVVNSAPGAGLRFEPSARHEDGAAALAWAEGLARRNMRLIRILDTETGAIFDEKGLREELKRRRAAT